MSNADNPWLSGDVIRGVDYDERFQRLRAAGQNVHGEADLVASLGVASVLDAGCGTGRVAIELAARGIEVVGVDLDPAMLAIAEHKAPQLSWIQSDLAALDLGRTFEAVMTAGNVMIFLTPGTEAQVISRLVAHLDPGGLLIAGFSVTPATLPVQVYDELAARAGAQLVARFSTWQQAVFADGDDYAVSIHRISNI